MAIVAGGVIPSAFQVATTDNYVSTLDIHKPDIDTEYYARYIDGGNNWGLHPYQMQA